MNSTKTSAVPPPTGRSAKAFVKMKFADFTRITRECLAIEPDRQIFHTLLETAWRQSERPARAVAGVRGEVCGGETGKGKWTRLSNT